MAEKEYVEREALFKAFERACWFDNADRDEIAEELLSQMPTADVVEARHGKWVLHADGSGTCDKCNTTQENVWDFDNWQNYCGHCGADMRGVPDTNVANKTDGNGDVVTCLNCKHLMFSDMYGECNKQLRIVNPSDTCEYAEPKDGKGDTE